MVGSGKSYGTADIAMLEVIAHLDWYVADWGDDENTCTDPRHPCRTATEVQRRYESVKKIHWLPSNRLFPAEPNVKWETATGDVALTGREVSGLRPTYGQVMCFNGTEWKWVPSTRTDAGACP